MEREQLKEELIYKAINAEKLLWLIRELVELKKNLTRSDISSLRTILELAIEELQEADNLFEELAFKTPSKVEVANV
ncbi:hypothetical protein GFV12_05345 [Desulfurobacterium thermolithotrophum]|uniref:hypothetical protein n=1 Tax=Desulfurobacterium thermolithotrophum TaxID=64160 RepID=UPI0013D83F0D|nr:hypothetical protein [Desulfurobacterium thermolithotrophum]